MIAKRFCFVLSIWDFLDRSLFVVNFAVIRCKDLNRQNGGDINAYVKVSGNEYEMVPNDILLKNFPFVDRWPFYQPIQELRTDFNGLPFSETHRNHFSIIVSSLIVRRTIRPSEFNWRYGIGIVNSSEF